LSPDYLIADSDYVIIEVKKALFIQPDLNSFHPKTTSMLGKKIASRLTN